MKGTTLLSLLLALTTFCAGSHAQERFQVTEIAPYDKAAPGLIMELLVAGLAGDAGPLMLPAEDFKLLVSQDGTTQEAKIRTVNATMRSRPRLDNSANDGADLSKMRAYQSVHFVVPGGLHAGEAELRLSYRGASGNPITLKIVDKPLRPTVGAMAVITISTSSLPAPGTKISGNDLGWRLERGSTTQLLVNPLVDPDDPNSAVLIRFKQSDTYYDASARVRNEPFKVQQRSGGAGFFPARDILEVEVPAALTMGPAEVEVRLRANGQESDPVKFTATITDTTRAAEAPAENAPRLLLVAPARLGAGQTLMLSLDYRRTLDPDPSQTMIIIEQESARYLIRPEHTSLKYNPSKAQDAPVVFFVRTTKQIIGKAQIRIFNQLRGQQGGMSEPTPIEILDQPLAPDLLGVNESTEAELAPLRQMYELQSRAGRKFQEYDPQRRYATIHARGVDYNPRYVRITFAQNGQSSVLTPEDFSLLSNDTLIVRLPKELTSGSAIMSIENRGVDSYSKPVSKKLEICCAPK